MLHERIISVFLSLADMSEILSNGKHHCSTVYSGQLEKNYGSFYGVYLSLTLFLRNPFLSTLT